MVERQEMELKEQETYINCLTQRMQNDFTGSSRGKAIGCSSSVALTESDRCVKPGKVRSIVRQMSCGKRKSNCRYGIGCQCGSSKNSSNHTKMQSSNVSAATSIDSVHNKSKEISKNLELSPESSQGDLTLTKNSGIGVEEAIRLKEEISSDEIRLLRQENSVLDEELTRYKNEIKEMSSVMVAIEKERESNACFVREVNCSHTQEMESLRSQLRTSICEKDDELCLLKVRMQAEFEKTRDLEKNLNLYREELQKLKCVKNCSQELDAELKCKQPDATQQALSINEIQGKCETVCDENSKLKKRIRELEIDLAEQGKCATRPHTENEVQNREFLKKCVKQLKTNYLALQKEKLEMIQSYENKIKTLECENESAPCRGPVEKSCACNWSSANNSGDVLLRKASKFGLCSLCPDELSDLHNRLRVSMLNAKKSNHDNNDDYCATMADEIRVKYNLSDSLQPAMGFEDFPVKDIDMSSSKTLPSILRCTTRRPFSEGSSDKPRAQSSENKIGTSAKCVKISRRVQKK